MSERPVAQTFPRRDPDGRVLALPPFIAVALGYAVVNALGLAIIDVGVGLLSPSFGEADQTSAWGRSPGWLILILPGLLYFDELRAWRGYGIRFLVAIVAAAVAVGLGLIAAGLVPGPPIVTGGVGAVVAVLVYPPLWFLGIRWLSGDNPTERS